MISSPLAGIRCWRRGLSRGSGKSSTAHCRCVPSSAFPSSANSPSTWRSCRMPQPPPALQGDQGNAFEPFPLTPVQQAYWFGRQQLVALGDVACQAYAELVMRDLDLPASRRRGRARSTATRCCARLWRPTARSASSRRCRPSSSRGRLHPVPRAPWARPPPRRHARSCRTSCSDRPLAAVRHPGDAPARRRMARARRH